MIDEETKDFIRRIAEALEKISNIDNTNRIPSDVSRALISKDSTPNSTSSRREYSNREASGDNLSKSIESLSEKRSQVAKEAIQKRQRNSKGQLVSSKKPSKTPAKPAKDNKAHLIVKAYCDAYKSRYGKYPIIDGRTQGAANRLAKVLPVDKLHLLLQIYCQMEDKWFVERRHDLSTFEINIGKVDLALHAGHENTNINWNKIFGEGHGQESIPTTNRSNEENLGGTQLPRGAPSTLLAKLPTDPK